MRKPTWFLLAALLAWGSACKKDSKNAEPPADRQVPAAEPVAQEPPVDPAAAAAEKEAADKAAAEQEAKRKETEEVAKAIAEDEQEAAVEAQRWTEDLKKRSAALVAEKYKTPRSALKAVLVSQHRVPANRERDRYRHPLETLTFFGIKQNMTVVELGTGPGWYTEILAPFLARDGKLIAVTYDPNGPADSGRTVYGKRTMLFLAKSPELFGKVELAYIDPPAKLELGPAGSADMVVAMREMHNWQWRGEIDAYLAAIHRVLKDGGTLGVEQHRAAAGGVADETAVKGYLPQDWLIEKIESAGFKLVAVSEVNANPKDTKDYEKGVWTLPPNYAAGDVDREKYTAIGESDRMTLRFKKVAAAAK